MIGSVRSLTAADIRGSAVASVAKSVRKDEFAEKVAIECGRKRLVGARVETHSSILTKQESNRIISYRTMYIHTARDAEGIPLW